MADPNASFPTTPESLGTAGLAGTAGPADLEPVAKAIVLLTAGDITILPVNNDDTDTLSFVGLPAGWVSPYRVRRVTAATAAWATVDG